MYTYPKFYWKHKVGYHVIAFDDTPFSLGENRTLDCQYGHHYYKSKSHSSKKVFLQGSRKNGCKAHINIVEFNLYPEYSIKQSVSSRASKNQLWKSREANLSELQKLFESGKPPLITKKYFVSLPTEEAHHKCHPTKGIMGFSQRVHPELIAKIQEFVSIGTVDPIEVHPAKTPCKTLHVCL